MPFDRLVAKTLAASFGLCFNKCLSALYRTCPQTDIQTHISGFPPALENETTFSKSGNFEKTIKSGNFK